MEQNTGLACTPSLADDHQDGPHLNSQRAVHLRQKSMGRACIHNVDFTSVPLNSDCRLNGNPTPLLQKHGVRSSLSLFRRSRFWKWLLLAYSRLSVKVVFPASTWARILIIDNVHVYPPYKAQWRKTSAANTLPLGIMTSTNRGSMTAYMSRCPSRYLLKAKVFLNWVQTKPPARQSFLRPLSNFI